jgi:uracil-DNA glycosylase family 4
MAEWEDSFDAEFVCPICKSTDVVPASGNIDSPYLIIGSYPGDIEVKEHQPMTGKTGGVLKAELRKLGRDISEFRITNLWTHPVPTNKKDENYEKCFNYGVSLVVKEALGKKSILLIGSDPTKYFCGVSVEAYNGLRTTSQYLSCPNIFICVQPTMVFKGGVGEFRTSLTKWITFLNRLEESENGGKIEFA